MRFWENRGDHLGKTEGQTEPERRGIIYLFSQQIFNECLLHARHPFRNSGHSGHVKIGKLLASMELIFPGA